MEVLKAPVHFSQKESWYQFVHANRYVGFGHVHLSNPASPSPGIQPLDASRWIGAELTARTSFPKP